MSSLKSPLVTVIVPVYNEEKNVKQSISRLINVVQLDLSSKKRWSTEILIVDDGSTDNSVDIIYGIIKDKPMIKLIRHKRNKGKGSAISTALRYAKGNICIIQDADLEYDPSELMNVLKPIIEGKAHVVYGSRFMLLKYYNGMWSNLLGNKALSIAGSLLIQRRITDIMTCYKAFHKKLLNNVKANSFDVEPEITAKLLLNHSIKFLEVPISYYPRLEGKKIKKVDGFISLWRLITTILSVQKENRLNKNSVNFND